MIFHGYFLSDGAWLEAQQCVLQYYLSFFRARLFAPGQPCTKRRESFLPGSFAPNLS